MRTPNPEETRVETITAALVYLLSHYARTGCPRVAACVARHLQCLSLHPDAAPVLRDVCASLHGSWCEAEGRRDAPGALMDRRRKLWEVGIGYLCPLVGTCVPIEFSRLAHKDLDARFAAALARFAKVDSEPALLGLWKDALRSGEVAGPLWALMTHPLASHPILQLASQDMHMLSHQAGAASRADLRRLAELEQENRDLRGRLNDLHCNATRQLRAKEGRIAALERQLASSRSCSSSARSASSRAQRASLSGRRLPAGSPGSAAGAGVPWSRRSWRSVSCRRNCVPAASLVPQGDTLLRTAA